ncbi:hypothetical protein [Mesorhizobium sp. KR9-304]|uniref:hypothetical protein n=1 Tax=Mesorhizobium sp. KR9-304 TaxID=3156614 RepID=UPI0032B45555
MMAKAKEAAPATVNNPAVLISKKTGDLWQDDRRNWCAYCGDSIDFAANKAGAANATRDHVFPKSHTTGGIKIPACLPCNRARKAQSLPEFLASAYFDAVRKKKPARAWPLQNLWLVLAFAAVEQARRHSEEWPSKKQGRTEPG